MKGGRIIVAEDDSRQARVLSLCLEREGHMVVVAKNGLQAVEEFRRRRPDLLILDVMMPNLDGHDVCRIVRAEDDVPILLLTARSTEDDVLVGLDLTRRPRGMWIIDFGTDMPEADAALFEAPFEYVKNCVKPQR